MEQPIGPPPPHLAMVEPVDATPTAVYHKATMSAKLPNFRGIELLDKAEELLREIQNGFNIIEIPERLEVRFGKYMLIGDSKAWWSTLLEIKYNGREPASEEFIDVFKQAYVAVVIRENGVREFLDLT